MWGDKTKSVKWERVPALSEKEMREAYRGLRSSRYWVAIMQDLDEAITDDLELLLRPELSEREVERGRGSASGLTAFKAMLQERVSESEKD